MRQPSTATPNVLCTGIKAALRSSENCTRDTVLCLSRLLMSSPADLSKDTKRRTTHPARQTKSSTYKLTTDSSSTPEAENSIGLSRNERLLLATETFNLASKVISDHLRRTESPTSRTPKASPGRSPLKVTSSNRRTPPRNIRSSDPVQLKLEEKDNDSTSGVVQVANCARTSLTALLEIQQQRGELELSDSLRQLEQGFSVLIGKLSALQLHDAAFDELARQRDRIAKYQRKDGTTQRKQISIERGNHFTIAKGMASQLLVFDQLPATEGLSALVMAYQQQVLKAVLAARQPTALKNMPSVLVPSNEHCPANVILSAHRKGFIQKERAIQQLQTLAHTVASLSSLTPKDSDGKLTNSKVSQYVDILDLQIASLEIRSLAWTLADHKCDEVKDLWEPLAKFFGLFARRCPVVHKQGLSTIKQSYVRLKNTLRLGGYHLSSTTRAGAVSTVFTILGQKSQVAAAFEDADIFYHRSLTSIPVGHPALIATCHIRIALLNIETSADTKADRSSAITKSISEALGCLGQSLKGSQTELDELIIESAKLTKIIMNILGGTRQRDHFTNLKKDASLLISFVHQFVKILKRYIGQPLNAPDGTDTQLQALFLSRFTKFRGIVSSSIESLITIGKLSLNGEVPLDWEEVLASLSDCLCFLEFIRHFEGTHDENAQTRKPLGFVKLSNLYWSRYLKLKAANSTKDEQILALQQCAKVLQKCPSPERYQGFLGYKLERLASLYLDTGKTEQAISAYRSSIEAYIEAGSLLDAAEDAKSAPLGKILKDSNGRGFTLHRALSQFVKLNWRSGNRSFVMDTDLSLDQRVILLESQLLTVTELVTSKPNEDYMDALSVIVHTLMTLYPINNNPIRRARVCLQAVRFALNSPGKLDEELFKAVIRESEIILTDESDHGQDKGLRNYRSSILTSLHFFCAMCFGHLSRENLETVTRGIVTISHECDSWSDVSSKIEEPESWIRQCQTFINYLEMRGYWKLRLSALSALIRILEVSRNHATELLSCFAQLVLQYTRLGLAKQAAAALSNARSLVETNEMGPAALISWYLALAALAIEERNLDQAWEYLASARDTFDQGVVDTSGAAFFERTILERLVTDAATLHSRLAFYAGDSQSAISFAKLSVKMSNRIWARLDRYCGQHWTKRQNSVNSCSLETDTIDEKLSRLSLKQDPTSSLYREGCTYWHHFLSHFSSLLHLSRLSSHYGLYQDTIYFAEQAHECALGIGSTASVILAKAFLGEQYMLAGDFEKGNKFANSALEGISSLDGNREIVASYSRYLGLKAVMKPVDTEQIPFHLAYKAFEQFLANASEEAGSSTIEMLGQQLHELTIDGELDRTHSKDCIVSKTVRPEDQSILEPSLLRLQGYLLRQEAETMLLSRNTNKASLLLDAAETYPKDDSEDISNILLRAKLLLVRAADKLSSHAVYCVLSESTYSMPSVLATACHTPQAGRSSRAHGTRTRSTTASARTKSPVIQQRARARVPVQGEYSTLLSAAKDLLMGGSKKIVQHGSASDNLQLSRLLSQVQLMESATTAAPELSMTAFLRSIIENGKKLPFSQETAFILADKKLSSGFEPLAWPAMAQQPKCLSISDEDILGQCIERLPVNWNIVSLTLNADQSEMIITRLQFNEEVFVLRLPLKRGNAEDADEEDTFGFAQGKAEITEIIQDANRSAHDTRARNGDREDKKKWWANRELLDSRLKDFLKNIETLWFGGFRGVFFPKSRDDELFDTFCCTFDKLLSKHLPSRRQRGKQKHAQLKINSAVLDLFVKLDKLDTEDDPEELVMDLLYFVVDILQFHGERNAYDEIDFDQMTVEVIDAIKAYTEANTRKNRQRDEHIILVLDKELHLFPWESLGFLKGAAVTRVPSLQCVNERLSRHHENGAKVGRDSVSYILNPGGDLKSTQAKFQPVFSSMPGWSGIVGRSPSEEEFQHALESNEVVLYFGHGSGAQYIRGRTIRRLDQCAVTFLMGCSSGVLTEAHEFEPYGTPLNYMHAGAGALVATLWDVTDKDIDRFTKAALEKWGLIPSTRYLPRSRAQKEQEAMEPRKREEESPIGIDSAISQSRDSCIFKYLNGAAPVVYGIPMFLK